ncbi:MAG: hypothetical protein AB1432_14690 [Bacteroidota bacterium]
MNYVNELITNKEIFFRFMKEKYPIFFNSNIFLRDLLYSIKSYFERKDKFLTYAQCEKLALDYISYLENSNDLKKVGNNAWKVNFFDKPVVTKTEPVGKE